MHKSVGGIIGYVVGAVVMVAVGIFIINRITFVRDIVYGKAA